MANCFNVNSLFDDSPGIVGINKSILVADNYANVCRLQASNWCNYKPQLTNEENFYRVNRGSFGWIGRNASFPLMKTLLGSSFFFHDFALFCLLPQVSRDSPNETNRLRRERDELQSLVEKFEKHLTEVSGFCIWQKWYPLQGLFPSQIGIGSQGPTRFSSGEVRIYVESFSGIMWSVHWCSF